MPNDTENKPAATAAPQQAIVTERVVTREVKEPPNGPNVKTDPEKPGEHYYEISNGDGTSRRVNAWGEEKGSAEDKRRFA